MIRSLGVLLAIAGVLFVFGISGGASRAEGADCACCACIGPHMPAANSGKADAQLAVSRCYQTFAGKSACGADAGKALYWLDKAARAGSAEAQHLLGWTYMRGDGVAVDPATGVGWWKKAAQAEYAPAQFDLGEAYDLGIGVQQDRTQAGQWHAAAERRGYAKYRQSHPDLPALREPAGGKQ